MRKCKEGWTNVSKEGEMKYNRMYVVSEIGCCGEGCGMLGGVQRDSWENGKNCIFAFKNI